MKKVLIISMFLYSLNSFSQFKSIYSYQVSSRNDDYSDYLKIKIKGVFFEISNKDLKKANKNIYDFKPDKVVYQMVYDRRYLFVFYFPENLRGQSFGLEILRLNQLEVIDLLDPEKKWFFDFSNLEKEHNLGLGFQNISKFDPTEGKLYFTFNFTYDEKSRIESGNASRVVLSL